jgi:hypothetical protein
VKGLHLNAAVTLELGGRRGEVVNEAKEVGVTGQREEVWEVIEQREEVIGWREEVWEAREGSEELQVVREGSEEVQVVREGREGRVRIEVEVLHVDDLKKKGPL